MRLGRTWLLLILCAVPIAAMGDDILAPSPRPASIRGTVTDDQEAAIPGATVTIDGLGSNEHRTLTTNETGAFEADGLDPSVSYKITVGAKGFADWTSQPIALKPGQSLEAPEIRLKISVVETTVVAMTVEQLAQQQVATELKQRVFGVIPNFFVVYDQHPVPLSAKQKYKIAFKAATDIVSIAGDFVLAGINQAADAEPDYQQGVKGYAQRFGAAYADSFSNVMLGGAVLPSLLHQDPRYYYQGTGTGRSRAMHALLSPFICPGDNGKRQFNASSIGGDVIAASLTNLYYPKNDRGGGIVVSSTLINTGGRVADALVQEFILGKYTTNSGKH